MADAQIETDSESTQTLPPSEHQARLKALEEKKKENEAQLAVLTSENNLLKSKTEATNAEIEAITAAQSKKLAGLPTSDFKGFEGNVDISSASTQFGEILAYKALAGVASKISAEICKKSSEVDKVILGDTEQFIKIIAAGPLINLELDNFETDINNGKNAIEAQAVSLRDGSESVVATAGTILKAIPAVAGAVSDITKLFRTDVKLGAIAVEIDPRALQAAIGQCSGISFMDPKRVIPTGEQETFKKLRGIKTALSEMNNSADKLLSEIDIERTKHKKDMTEADNLIARLIANVGLRESQEFTDTDQGKYEGLLADKLAAQQQMDEIDAVKARVETRVNAVNTSAETLINNVTTSTETQPSIAQTLAVWDSIMPSNGVTPSTEVAFLSATIETVGAQSMVSKSGFRNARLSYSGSVVATYKLTKSTGQVLSSGIFDSTQAITAKRGKGFSNLADKAVRGN